MALVIGVRFKRMGKVYYFDPGDLQFTEGDGAIVETVRGVEYGDVTMLPQEIGEEEIFAPLKPVLRVATEADKRQVRENEIKERQALAIGTERIAEHKLDMKLVDVEYTFDGRKVVFYFTADGRVDFRDLVRDLATRFRARIELRQIGVRDEAKMLGGLGPCGRPICCKSFMADFIPVSIRMAKDQNISLNPTKISGLCGRLMCCLEFEHEHYVKARKELPKVGLDVMTPDGPGEVTDVQILREKVKVRITLPDMSMDVREYAPDMLKPMTAEEKEAALQTLASQASSVRSDSGSWQRAKAQAAERIRQEAANTREAAEPQAENAERPRNRRRREHGRSEGNREPAAKPETAPAPNPEEGKPTAEEKGDKPHRRHRFNRRRGGHDEGGKPPENPAPAP